MVATNNMGLLCTGNVTSENEELNIFQLKSFHIK
jgi:hypothetical protein